MGTGVKASIGLYQFEQRSVYSTRQLAYCAASGSLTDHRYGIRCQAPAADRAGLRQGCRPVKTTASAHEASSGGASRTISGPAGGLDSGGGSPGVPPRSDCQLLRLLGRRRAIRLLFLHHRPGQMQQLTGSGATGDLHRLPRRTQALIERPKARIVSGCRQGRHVQRRSQPAVSSVANLSPAA
jgi:hypothetical protein